MSNTDPSETTVAPAWRVWLRPQVLLSTLLCLVCFGLFLSTLRRPAVPLIQEDIQATEEAAPQIFELVVVQAGEERVLRQRSSLGAGPSERLQAVLTTLASTDVWPEGLELPQVFVFRDSQEVALLDFSPKPTVAVSAQAEWDLLRSIQATLERQGVDEVRILVEGQEASTFLGHVRP